VTLTDVGTGSRYYFLLDDGLARPAPSPHYQLTGVPGPSEVIDPDAFRWTNQAWTNLALKDVLLYELYVGTFTPEGTIAAIIRYLDYPRRN
jgi:maltooligosyltrehalose trehalohydrolase